MYKIGEFARAGNVTVKTLRHYARIGLLRPGWVDRFTGYRYYTDDQLNCLNRILALKDLGFSLKQVSLLLDDDLQIGKLRSMFAMKQNELTQRVQIEQRRLEQVEERLHQIEKEEYELLTKSEIIKEKKMELKLITKPAFTVVGLLYVGKNQNNEISGTWNDFNKRNELICTGDAAYGICQWVNDGADGTFEYLAGFEVDPNAPIPAGMTARTVPANTWAVFEHRGAITTLKQTYNHIYQEAIPASNYRPTRDGLDMEVYTEEFTYFAPDSIMYIYVPVIPR